MYKEKFGEARVQSMMPRMEQVGCPTHSGACCWSCMPGVPPCTLPISNAAPSLHTELRTHFKHGIGTVLLKGKLL